MFNRERLRAAEARIERLEKELSEVRAALTDNRGMCYSIYPSRILYKSADIDRRISRLMKHLGLREEFVQEHTIITKEKK